MLTKVQKWGNSIALRIPKAFAEEMRIAADSMVELTIEAGRLVLSPVEPQAYSLEALLAGVSPENSHAAVDWGEPIGKEAW